MRGLNRKKEALLDSHRKWVTKITSLTNTKCNHMTTAYCKSVCERKRDNDLNAGLLLWDYSKTYDIENRPTAVATIFLVHIRMQRRVRGGRGRSGMLWLVGRVSAHIHTQAEETEIGDAGRFIMCCEEREIITHECSISWGKRMTWCRADVRQNKRQRDAEEDIRCVNVSGRNIIRLSHEYISFFTMTFFIMQKSALFFSKNIYILKWRNHFYWTLQCFFSFQNHINKLNGLIISY